ncbi:MAG TPA: FAD-binding oxidoreductase, partial [Acetobacteraceae bacterium]|nr:FAD-binding oxidoreductase [Acetobacteraceae bacterium]
HGASGRNFGQVVPYLKRGPAEIARAFAPATAERVIARVGEGPATVFALIDRYAIQCQARRSGLLFAAHSEAGRRALEARTRFWQARGADVQMHGAEDTARLVGSEHYQACSVDRRGGTINPVGYARGLAHAAAALGCRLFTHSPALGIERNGTKWLVRTRAGRVTADQAVLATNAYTARGLWPGLRESIIPVRGYAMVSAPLGDNLRAGILPGGQPLTDTRRTHSGIRLNADGCIHASTLGPPLAVGGTPDVARLDRRIAALFPLLGRLDWRHRWAGWIALSRDDYPHLHELAPGLWAGLGYSGRGIAAATLMGEDIAALAAGLAESGTTFPVTRLKRWWAVPFARPVVGMAMAYNRFRDALDRP